MLTGNKICLLCILHGKITYGLHISVFNRTLWCKGLYFATYMIYGIFLWRAICISNNCHTHKDSNPHKWRTKKTKFSQIETERHQRALHISCRRSEIPFYPQCLIFPITANLYSHTVIISWDYPLCIPSLSFFFNPWKARWGKKKPLVPSAHSQLFK